MDKTTKKVIAIVIIVVFAYGVYHFADEIDTAMRNTFFASEERKSQLKKLSKLSQGVQIYNDSKSEIIVEFAKDGQFTREICEPGDYLRDTQGGEIRIFVPEKKGWYIIEYPYPYPLTQSIWNIFYGPRFVAVRLSGIIDALQTGQIEYYGLLVRDEYKLGVVKDIKTIGYERTEL